MVWTPFHYILDALKPTAATGMAANIISVLATQKCPQIVLWVRPHSISEVQSTFSQHTETQYQGIVNEAFALSIIQVMALPDGGRFQDHVSSIPSNYACPHPDSDIIAWSDCWRLAVLRARGGVYIDTDVLLLRDLSPLLQYDILTPWGWDCEQEHVNNAIMHYTPQSVLLSHIMAAGIKSYLPMKTWPATACRHNPVCNRSTALIVPNAFFDAYWIQDVNGCQPHCGQFTCYRCPFFDGCCTHNCSHVNFMSGALGLHYHTVLNVAGNQVSGKPHHYPGRKPGSIADQLLVSKAPIAAAKLASIRQQI